jgi:glycosyltransferase involved in cell wall biosynthesis
LIEALAELDPVNEYVLLAARGTSHAAPLGANFKSRRLPLPERALNILWHRLRVPLPVEALAGTDWDLFHAPNFTLPPTRAARRVVTIHDLTFLRYPQGAVPSLRSFLLDATPRAARRATRIIADSQATKDDLVEWLHVDDAKISVVYAGVDARFQPVTDNTLLESVRSKYGFTHPFILGLGTLEPRKNFTGLIRAFGAAHLPDHELVIAGRPGWLYESIAAAARATPGVRLLGYAQEADLPALYTLASAFCLPSYYEGFGIPCIEAMACGTPVVCSDRPCLPEIVGEAAVRVPPDDTEALAGALERLVLDTAFRQDLITRGHERARAFPWSRGASALLRAYTD